MAEAEGGHRRGPTPDSTAAARASSSAGSITQPTALKQGAGTLAGALREAPRSDTGRPPLLASAKEHAPEI